MAVPYLSRSIQKRPNGATRVGRRSQSDQLTSLNRPMSAICGQRLLEFADYVTEVPVRLQGGPLWRWIDAFGFRILAEGNFIWGKKKSGKLCHCFLQNISPDEALLLIENQRRASMVRGRPQLTMASKTTFLEPLDGLPPQIMHWRWNRWNPDRRSRPDQSDIAFSK